ncbi:Zinc finger protein like [Heracleum sosnowskyi]|uniref:Zinc finger protein like n=1 Tax=Heracleum sosnowskyi TaxID=360622 RepID=A0AAD8MVX3_9APIA|nr:Zinc finger protein like [Heracleum sosnowskyi]
MADIAGSKKFPMRAKPCDTCKSNAALVFCCTDSTYMCMDCDSKIHGNNSYERVWMCEVCEHAPSSVTCKADAAALCVMCDWDIHSANPLARRHQRVPVTPFYRSAVSVMKSTATAILEVAVAPESEANFIGYQNCNKSLCHGHEETKLSADIQADMKSIDFLFSDPDNLLEFDYPVPNDPIPLYRHHNTCADSVVPVQINGKLPLQASSITGSVDNHFEIDFTTSNVSSFNNNYAAPSLSQNISSAVGIGPDGSCMSDTSYPFALQMNNNVKTNTGNGQVLVAMDREARVMRYREKRKNRKFQKTIRYASRKAYAETRPRIKGRFAKRTENAEDANEWFTPVPATTNFMGNSEFGMVPSF